MRAGLALVLLVCTSLPAAACQTNAGCIAPSTCQFAGGLREGECRDPTPPPLSRGEKAHLPPLTERKVGDACQFNVDCGVGMNCYKNPGASEGRCSPPAR